MFESPYVEPANVNPMDRFAPMQQPLHEYGSWILSGTCSVWF